MELEEFRRAFQQTTDNGIFFDNGAGMKNNNNRKMMFIRIC